MKKIIITIPAYNEEGNIASTLGEIKKILPQLKYKCEIQVVSDGSRDKTVEIAKKEGAEVIAFKRNRGLAKTFQTALEYCIKKQADIIVHTGADGQYPASSIPELIKK